MTDDTVPPSSAAHNSTDDVRQVRVGLDRRFHGDIGKLCAHARRVSTPYIRKLNLKPMPATRPPSRKSSRGQRSAAKT
jgi:hypothetical protein